MWDFLCTFVADFKKNTFTLYYDRNNTRRISICIADTFWF